MATMAQRYKSDKRTEQGGVFRILVGSHLGDGPEGCECDTCIGGDTKNHRYRARQRNDPPEYEGDIIETEVDLCARHNMGSGSYKFERLTEQAEPIQRTSPPRQQKPKEKTEPS